jgi:arsenate reductase
MNKLTILFLCTHNAARSQIAEALINARLGDRYVACSAGSEPTEVHPCAIEVMAELGIDISRQRAKSLSEFNDSFFDYVVTMCADAAENCPIFPGGATYLQHPFDDPAVSAGSGAGECAHFRYVRDQIGKWIETTFSHSH